MMKKNGRKIGAVLVASLALGGVAFAGMEAVEGQDRTAKKERMEQRRQKALEKFDANRDGKLDEAERAQMKKARAEAVFRKLDKDGNGVLSLEEFEAGMGKRGKHGHRKHGR